MQLLLLQVVQLFIKICVGNYFFTKISIEANNAVKHTFLHKTEFYTFILDVSSYYQGVKTYCLYFVQKSDLLFVSF